MSSVGLVYLNELGAEVSKIEGFISECEAKLRLARTRFRLECEIGIADSLRKEVEAICECFKVTPHPDNKREFESVRDAYFALLMKLAGVEEDAQKRLVLF